MNNEILVVDDVVKIYDKYVAVDHLSFSMPEGSIFGLLGPNGAGKSSLIRMITTITRPDTGKIFISGEPLNNKHPENIGYMPEERGLYKKMKVGDQLLYLAQLKGLSYTDAKREIRYWLEKMEITDWWNKKVEELSKGMQQKAQFISTVIHKPRLLILDEPFSGLDPVNAEVLKNEIYELSKNGTSIIFSTHRMEQVEEICDRILLINKGKNILYGSVKDVKQQFKENLFSIEHKGTLPDAFYGQVAVQKETPENVTFKISGNTTANALLKEILETSVTVTGFNEILPSLNEIFIKRVGQEFN